MGTYNVGLTNSEVYNYLRANYPRREDDSLDASELVFVTSSGEPKRIYFEDFAEILKEELHATEIDDTLSVPGAAADAKAAGDKLRELQGDLQGLSKRICTDLAASYPHTSATSGGVAYSWTGNTCTISGTLTGASFNNIVNSQTSLPAGMRQNGYYLLKFSTTNKVHARFGIVWYRSSGADEIRWYTKDTVFRVPSDAVGVILRVGAIASTGTAISATVVFGGILTCYDPEDALNLLVHGAYNFAALESAADKTQNGVKFSWKDNAVSVVGTTTGPAWNDIYNNTSAMPKWLTAGDTYWISIKSTNKYILFTIAPYSNGTALTHTELSQSGYYTVPSNATGIILRITTITGITYNDTAIVGIYNAASNAELTEIADSLDTRLTDVQNRVGAVTNAPMLTIIDDDGNAKFYSDLYPIITSKKVPIASAIPYSLIGDSGSMSEAQIKEIYAGGAEILCHTYGHWISFDGKTEADFEDDYRKARNSYNLLGIPADILVYSADSGNLTQAREAAKRVFRGAIDSGRETTNYCGDDKYRIRRYGVNGDGSDGRLNGNVLSSLTGAIDALAASGGWMIWMIHTSANYWGDTMLSNISDAIDYCLGKNIPIVTAEYGFRAYFGN